MSCENSLICHYYEWQVSNNLGASNCNSVPKLTSMLKRDAKWHIFRPSFKYLELALVRVAWATGYAVRVRLSTMRFFSHEAPEKPSWDTLQTQNAKYCSNVSLKALYSIVWLPNHLSCQLHNVGDQQYGRRERPIEDHSYIEQFYIQM